MTHQATQLPIISDPTDRERLNLLYRTKGDTVSFAGLRHEDPLDLLAWLNQPHIQPWHAAIATAFRENREADTQQSLSRSLRDVTRILDLEASSTLRIRAVNAIIRLANAIKRASSLPAAGRAGVGLANASSAQRAAKELHHAQERVLDEMSRLSINIERRGYHKDELEDAKAPVGTVPSWARSDPLPSDPLPPGGGPGWGWRASPANPPAPNRRPPRATQSKIENRKSKIPWHTVATPTPPRATPLPKLANPKSKTPSPSPAAAPSPHPTNPAPAAANPAPPDLPNK